MISWWFVLVIYLLVGALIGGVALRQVNERHLGVYVLVVLFWLPLTVSSAVKALFRGG